MKKMNRFRSILIIAAVVLLVSCASGPATTTSATENSPETSAQELPAPKLPVNYSSLSSEQEGSELTVTGLFSKEADGLSALVTNPESRSRVTFVLADPEGVLARAAPEDGSVITVTGILTDASATWRKHLDVVAIR